MSMSEATPLPLSLGQQLAAARHNTHLDQTEMGEIAGYDRTTISRWERGTHQPPFDYVVLLSRMSDWPLDLLARAVTNAWPGPSGPGDMGVSPSACYGGSARILAFPLAA